MKTVTLTAEEILDLHLGLKQDATPREKQFALKVLNESGLTMPTRDELVRDTLGEKDA